MMSIYLIWRLIIVTLWFAAAAAFVSIAMVAWLGGVPVWAGPLALVGLRHVP